MLIKNIQKIIDIILNRKKYYKKIDWEYIPLTESEKNMLQNFGDGCLKSAEKFRQDNNTKK